MSGQNLDNDIKVAIARGIHLFPFRTEKLSLVTPMVLRNSGRVGSRRLEARRQPMERSQSVRGDSFFWYISSLPFSIFRCTLLFGWIRNCNFVLL